MIENNEEKKNNSNRQREKGRMSVKLICLEPPPTTKSFHLSISESNIDKLFQEFNTEDERGLL